MEDTEIIKKHPNTPKETDIKCEFCGEQFSQLGDLHRHKIQNHKVESIEEQIHSVNNQISP